MKKNLLTSVLVLSLGFILFSCKPSDEKLQKQVDTVLTVQPGISASVKSAVVTLNGVVESEEAKTAAETLVKNVKDIKSVVNNIEVKVPEPPVVINPDDTLKTTITAAFTAAGFKDITVDIKDGEVTLTGNAKKADLKQIMQIANEAQPKKVINNLTVK